jgi:hydrogenase maturation protein HypF
VRIFPFDTIASAQAAGRRIQIRGVVQGVGFRPWVYRVARESAVTGRVRNDNAGVTIEAFGPAPALDAFVDRLEHEPHRPAAAVIEALSAETIPYEAANSFEIIASDAGEDRRVAIPPDLATCPECLAEIRDPANRRHQYAFTNCTNCGPRFTIATATPYDRPNTTMAPFAMCPACGREYGDVGDRRFHAQPNACPVCGPRLDLLAADGQPLASGDVIGSAAHALLDGRIVALKGIGGFQLACDATSQEAVVRLRGRKHRDEKPFAVMVASLEEARRLATLSEAEEALLVTPERPIVLAAGRAGSPLAPAVAPGNLLVGVLLPNSPLHHLLLDRVARPLIMTSGNLSEEPIAFRNGDAVERLGGIADLFVVHDREIVTRCDDSVARIIAGRPTILRRARGYVPRPVLVREPFARPVLACGALLKNTSASAAATRPCSGRTSAISRTSRPTAPSSRASIGSNGS